MRIKPIITGLLYSTLFQIALGITLFFGTAYTVLTRAFDVGYLQQLSNRADNIYSSEYFNNFKTDKKVIIIPTGCWTAAGDAYTDSISLEPISEGSARFDRVLNEISHTQYQSDISFYQFGFPDPNFDTGLKNIYNALRQPNVKAIIYINAPGGLEAFVEPHGLVGIKETLEKIKQDYPSLTADAGFFLNKAVHSIGFKEDYWNEFFYKIKSYFPALGQFKSEMIAPPVFIKNYRAGDTKDEFTSITPENKKLFDEHQHQQFLKTFGISRTHYENPKSCGLPLRQMMPPNDFWQADGGVFESFIRLAAGMAQAKGVAFIYYIPPHLNVTNEQYQQSFKPLFVDRVTALLSGYPNAYLINHSNIDGFSTCDLAHIKENVFKPYDGNNHLPFEPFIANFAPGYVFNLIGKIKQSQTLLEELDVLGVVNLESVNPNNAGKFEVNLKGPKTASATYLLCSQYQSLFEIVLLPDRYRRSLQVGSVEPKPLEFDNLCKPF